MRLPPQVIDFEKQVLGAMVFDSSIVPDVLTVLNSYDFYLDKHSHIFAAIEVLHKNDIQIDILTLEERLRKSEKLAEAGGQVYLQEISAEVYTSSNFEEHCKIIKDKSLLRGLIKTSLSCIDASYKDLIEPYEIISDTQESLTTLSTSGIINKPESSGEVTQKVIDRLERIRKGDRLGFLTGIEEIDKITMGFRECDLNIIAGRPGWGKTAFAVWLMLQFEQQSHKCLFVSIEMSSDDLGDRILCNLSDIPNYSLKSPNMPRRNYQTIANKIELMARMNWKIDDQSSSFNAVSAAITREARNGYKIVFVDYLQLMSHSGKDRIEQVSAISNGLKRLAKKLKIAIFALSQMNRDSETKKEKPQPHHLKASGDIEQDASLILFPWPVGKIDEKEPKNKFYLIMAKNRHGVTCDIPMHGDLSINNFRVWSDGDDWSGGENGF